ncbi:MAG: poly-beta-1,6-N-acetyl-D-glucosamine biosynthesis protein PgaD [Candidimonas sp.]
MIITTPRSAAGSIFDALLTAFGWLGFLYLLFQGANAILAAYGASGMASLNDPFIPTLETLLFYLLIACINALVLGAWMKWRRTHEIHEQPRGRGDRLGTAGFTLSPDQLHHVQDSRVTIIHHSADGDIAGLEEVNSLARATDHDDVAPIARAA